MTNKLHKKTLITKTIFVSIALLLSKLLGIVRELFQVRYLGVTELSDAFNTAYKIPNLLRRLFAEGALSSAFIPTIVKVMRNDSEEQASKLMTLMALVFGMIVVALCIIVSFFPETLIYLVAPGFKERPVELATAASLLRILIYFVFFVFWSALFAAVLQSKMHFAVPSWGPALLNIFYIGGLIISIHFGLSVDAFAYFLLLGGLVQALLYLYVCFKLHFSFIWPDKRTGGYFKEVILKFIPSLFSASIVEINLVIDNRFASLLPTGSITLLTLSSRFMTIALGAFAVAFSSILLSHFSRISSYAPKRLSYYLLEATKLIFWVTVPVALLMGFFAHDIFYTIFYRLAGNFSLEQVNEASMLLIAFLPALFFLSLNKALLSMYYALHETRYPTLVTILGTGVLVMLNRFLMPLYGSVGIAVATSLSAAFQTALFIAILWWKYGFVLYVKRFAQFLLRFGLQLASISLLFYILYTLCRFIIKHTLSAYSDILLHTIGLWLWVGPLCLVLAGILYYGHKRYGVYIYFLE